MYQKVNLSEKPFRSQRPRKRAWMQKVPWDKITPLAIGQTAWTLDISFRKLVHLSLDQQLHVVTQLVYHPSTASEVNRIREFSKEHTFPTSSQRTGTIRSTWVWLVIQSVFWNVSASWPVSPGTAPLSLLGFSPSTSTGSAQTLEVIKNCPDIKGKYILESWAIKPQFSLKMEKSVQNFKIRNSNHSPKTRDHSYSYRISDPL